MLRNVNVTPRDTLLELSSLGAGGTIVSRGVADAARTRSLGSGGLVGGGGSRHLPHLFPCVSTAVISAIEGT